jgi:hypothetical protein
MSPLDLAKFLGLALFLAFLTESFTEYIFGKLCDLVKPLEPVKPYIFYVALVVGIGLAFWYKIDLIAWFMSGPVTPVGIILSGLSIGRGANFMHDIIQRFFLANAEKKQWMEIEANVGEDKPKE